MRLPRAVLPLLAALALFALPGTASAMLVYNIQPKRGPVQLWAAANDGGGATQLGSNFSSPQLSPDGALVLAVRTAKSGADELWLIRTDGGGATRLLRSVQSDL